MLTNFLKNFVDHIRKLLFNQSNIKESDLYYCIWCKEFGKKSKFKLNQQINSDWSDESNIIETLGKVFIRIQILILLSFILYNKLDNHASLTCTKCNRYLIKDNKVISLDQLEENSKLDDASSELNDRPSINNNNTSTPNYSNNLQELLNQTNKLQQSINSSSQSFNYNTTFTLKDVLKSKQAK